jgi:signal transduction histidine kinase
MVGQPIIVLFPPERRDEERMILARLQRGERVEHFETVRVHKDGHRIEVSLAISPIRDEDGHIIGASKIARDITAQKAAERDLAQAQARLAAHAVELEHIVRERTAELERLASEAQAFSYSLSHDIRAPLRTIQGFADLILGDVTEKMPEAVDYLRRIMRAAQRMDRLLTDVLAFSKVAQNEIHLEAIQPEAIVRDLVAERRNLQPPAVKLEIQEPLLPVVGNAPSLTQCLANLLDNAVKFVRPGVQPEVRVFTTLRDGRVRLSVQDNGIGVAPANQQRLFRVFERLHTQEQYEGTGLGLAIVRRAAERMGGSVGVESMVGQGSTFWIELPPATA